MTYYFDDLDDLYDYIDKYKYEVNDYIFSKIKEYIFNEEISENIILFQYKKISMIYKIEISSEFYDLISPLESCLIKYAESEEYEKCSHLKKNLEFVKLLLT